MSDSLICGIQMVPFAVCGDEEAEGPFLNTDNEVSAGQQCRRLVTIMHSIRLHFLSEFPITDTGN